jgi:ketosteroid isomerase-like protein
MEQLSQKDTDAIEQLHRRWIVAELGGSGLGVLPFCTDDVRWLVPNTAVLVGKEAAKLRLVNTNITIIEIETEGMEIRGSGSVAYKTSKYTTQVLSKETQDKQVVKGTHLWILHKMENEEWKVALVSWQFSS